jgi:hypothetical protein
MPSAVHTDEFTPGKPISVGLTCWLWQRKKARAMIELARLTGVRLELHEHWHGLRKTIEGSVSGENVDRFICEFGRHC